MVCASSDLARLDQQLSLAYGKARTAAADPAALKTAQLAWVKTLRQCADEACVAKAYRERTAELTK
jgi:uncharacterized protein